MKRLITVLVAAALALPIGAFAQYSGSFGPVPNLNLSKQGQTKTQKSIYCAMDSNNAISALTTYTQENPQNLAAKQALETLKKDNSQLLCTFDSNGSNLSLWAMARRH